MFRNILKTVNMFYCQSLCRFKFPAGVECRLRLQSQSRERSFLDGVLCLLSTVWRYLLLSIKNYENNKMKRRDLSLRPFRLESFLFCGCVCRPQSLY